MLTGGLVIGGLVIGVTLVAVEHSVRMDSGSRMVFFFVFFLDGCYLAFAFGSIHVVYLLG